MEFLKEKALPFMKEAALFYEDYFETGEDGYYVIYPSVSPENSPSNFVSVERAGLTHPMPSAINATMDFAIAKELLKNLINGSKKAGLYLNKIAGWENMLDKIPPYMVNSDGAVREWMHPDFNDNYNHRHLSHVYPVFPGREVDGENDKELFDAFRTAAEKRLIVGLSDQSGWSLAHMANIYARLADGEHALECLELLTRSCLMANLYTLHNDWRNMGICLPDKLAPVQLDANMGIVSAIQEMLLFSSADLIRILPAIPQKWGKGSVDGLHFYTGRISFAWDVLEGTFWAEIFADRDTSVSILFPCGFRYKYNSIDIETIVEQLNDRKFRVHICQGKVLHISGKHV